MVVPRSCVQVERVPRGRDVPVMITGGLRARNMASSLIDDILRTHKYQPNRQGSLRDKQDSGKWSEEMRKED